MSDKTTYTALELLEMEQKRHKGITDAAKVFIDSLQLPANFTGDCSFDMVDKVGKYRFVSSIRRISGKFWVKSAFGEDTEI